MSRNLRIIIGMTFFIFLSFGVNADEKSFLIAKAAVPYIMSTHYLGALSRTECTYAIKHKYDTQAAEREVLQVLRAADKTEMNTYISSKEYRANLTYQEQEAGKMLDLIKENGIDDKTACGMVIGMALGIYAQPLKGWAAAVKQYKR